MRYMQIREMLDRVRDFHEELGNYYHQLSEAADRERIKLLLDHISKHKKRLHDGLAAYEKDAPQQVLNTWVDSEYCDQVLALCETTFASRETDVDGVIEAAIEIDNSLIDFYREVAEHATSERVREVFQNLIELEESDLRHLALSALQLRDI